MTLGHAVFILVWLWGKIHPGRPGHVERLCGWCNLQAVLGRKYQIHPLTNLFLFDSLTLSAWILFSWVQTCFCFVQSLVQAFSLLPFLFQALTVIIHPCVKDASVPSPTASWWGSTTRHGTRSVCSAPCVNSPSPPAATSEKGNFTANTTTNSKHGLLFFFFLCSSSGRFGWCALI